MNDIEIVNAVVKSWACPGARPELNPGASSDEILAVQAELGRRFPDDLVALYRHTDGGGAVGGNIGLYQLREEEYSIADASNRSREHGWPIPDDLVLFGGDGAGDQFGLWLPRDGRARPLVVQVGQIFEPRCMAVVGTSLGRFLRGRTAYYLLAHQASAGALDALAVPGQYRGAIPGEDEYDALARWSDPDLPPLPLSPYKALLDATAVDSLARTSAG